MSKPIRVFWSPLTRRFYASRAWRERDNHIEITGQKFDVTQDIARAMVAYDIEFTERTEGEDDD